MLSRSIQREPTLSTQAPRRKPELQILLGFLHDSEIHDILKTQRRRRQPFGKLAARHHGLHGGVLADAWAHHFATAGAIETSRRWLTDTPTATSMLQRRQIWQFQLLPWCRRGDVVVCATTRVALKRAVRFAWRAMEPPTAFALVSPEALRVALDRHVPWSAMRALLQEGRPPTASEEEAA